MGKYKRLKITKPETGPIEASLVDIEVEDKSKLYPRVRNIFNENQPNYESEGIVFVNPNKFIRVKIVLNQLQKLTTMKTQSLRLRMMVLLQLRSKK